MKEIGSEKFGLIYDKINDYLEKSGGKVEGVGIEKGILWSVLLKSWNEGKKWDVIVFIIAYHYSRTESVILRFSGISTLIPERACFGEICRLLGIKMSLTDTDIYKISESDYKEEFKRLSSILYGQKKKSDFVSALDGLGLGGIGYRKLLWTNWKLENWVDVINAVIVLLRLTDFRTVELEMPGRSVLRFRKGQDCYDVLETLQNAPIVNA